MKSEGVHKPGPTDTAGQVLETATGILPLHDTQDFEDAERQVRAYDHRVVWDLDAYRFLDEPVAEAANRSLWRQGLGRR